MSAAVAAIRITDRTSFFSAYAHESSARSELSFGGVAAMSRDALIATTVALLFAAGIGGALWYRGFSLPIAQLASLDSILPTGSGIPDTNSSAGTPAPSPQIGTPAPGNAQPPLLPPAAPENEPAEKETPKLDPPKPAGKSVAKLPTPAAPAKAAVAKSPKGELAMPALPDGDLANDVPLPPVLNSSKPAPLTKPSLPASQPNMPVTVPEQVSVPGPPGIPPTKSAAKASTDDSFPSIADEPIDDDEKHELAKSPVPPAPPVVKAKSDALLPSLDAADAPKMDEDLAAPDLPKTPEPTVAAEPTTNRKSSLPESIPAIPQIPAVPEVTEKEKSAPLVPAAPAIVETPAPKQPKLSEADLKPVATATPTKNTTSPAAPVTVSASDKAATVSNLPKIPAPPSEMVSARAVQPPPSNGAMLGTPPVGTGKPVTPTVDPALTPKDVVATAHPIAGNVVTDENSPATAPIAQAKALRGSSPTAAATGELAPKSDEYLPLGNNQREYVPLGANRPSEEFVNIDKSNIPARNPTAFGETSVVSVRKTDLSDDQPRVVSYDAKAYLTLEGDSFERIAETMYHTPGYGEALARYNRSRFRAADELPTGAKVRVPPMEVLGQQRTAVANNGTSREAFQRVDRMPYVMPGAPNGTGNAIPVSNNAGPPSAFDHQLVGHPTPDSAAGNQYRTERQETLWSISKRHLGDGRRWREIYNLNRDRLASEIHVPAGTTLRMPTTTPQSSP